MGAIGGAVVEAYDIVAVARATRRWPWLDPRKSAEETTRVERWNAFGVWLLATIVRIAAGGGVAAAASSQMTGELAAFGLGVAGPLALERILTAYTSPASVVDGVSATAGTLTLHRIALSQTRLGGPGSVYYQRRRGNGDTTIDAMRALKRRLARVVYGLLRTVDSSATVAEAA
jgi:hypothetical protein